MDTTERDAARARLAEIESFAATLLEEAMHKATIVKELQEQLFMFVQETTFEFSAPVVAEWRWVSNVLRDKSQMQMARLFLLQQLYQKCCGRREAEIVWKRKVAWSSVSISSRSTSPQFCQTVPSSIAGPCKFS